MQEVKRVSRQRIKVFNCSDDDDEPQPEQPGTAASHAARPTLETAERLGVTRRPPDEGGSRTVPSASLWATLPGVEVAASQVAVAPQEAAPVAGAPAVSMPQSIEDLPQSLQDMPERLHASLLSMYRADWLRSAEEAQQREAAAEGEPGPWGRLRCRRRPSDSPETV
jgi:hypothetical protein